jgi:hypothetical protein
MLPSLQVFIAVLLSAVAFDCFAFAAHHSGRSTIAVLLLQWHGCLPQLPLRFSSP